MTSASTSSSLLQREARPVSQPENEFFAKLASFENALLSQQHPRYKLPADEVEKLASSLSAPAFAIQSPTRHEAPQKSLIKEPSELNASGTTQRQTPSAGHAPVPKPIPTPKPVNQNASSSAFDPILLTKSDGLIRAEINLKRHRIEKSLRDALTLRNKENSRDKDTGLGLPADAFDAAEVLESAKAVVQPISAFSPKRPSSPAPSSFDENSYYSSKGNSWSPLPMETPAAKDDKVESIEHDEGMEICNDDVRIREPRVSGLGPPRTEEEGTIQVDRTSFKPPTQVDDSADAPSTAVTDMEIVRDESYSPAEVSDEYEPPPPEHFAVPVQQSSPANDRESPDSSYYRLNRARESDSYSPPPPPDDPPQSGIVQDQVSAPIAAQLSRISELTLNSSAGTPESNQMGRRKRKRGQEPAPKQENKKKQPNNKKKEAKNAQTNKQGGVNSAKQTPQSQQAKRWELDESGNTVRRSVRLAQSHNQRIVISSSPEQPVKAEPPSPPSPSNQRPRRLILPEDGGVTIENISTRNTGRNLESSTGPSRHHKPVVPENSESSRVAPLTTNGSAGGQPVPRGRSLVDGPGLPRATSANYLPNDYPRLEVASYEPFEYNEVQRGRPIVRMPSTHAQYRPNSRMESDGQQYRSHSGMEFDSPRSRLYSVEQNPQFPIQRRTYDDWNSKLDTSNGWTAPSRHTSAIRQAPQRRIVTDEDGNQYIAVPASEFNQTHRQAIFDYPDPDFHPREPSFGPPRMTERRVYRRQEPEYIQIDDDEADDYMRMPPPPPPPAMIRRRPAEHNADRVPPRPSQLPMQYGSRSASLQPQPFQNPNFDSSHLHHHPSQAPAVSDRMRHTSNSYQRAPDLRASSAQPNYSYAANEYYH